MGVMKHEIHAHAAPIRHSLFTHPPQDTANTGGATLVGCDPPAEERLRAGGTVDGAVLTPEIRLWMREQRGLIRSFLASHHGRIEPIFPMRAAGEPRRGTRRQTNKTTRQTPTDARQNGTQVIK
jgi:hypothetical protein